jgi:hypothetical protein
MTIGTLILSIIVSSRFFALGERFRNSPRKTNTISILSRCQLPQPNCQTTTQAAKHLINFEADQASQAA